MPIDITTGQPVDRCYSCKRMLPFSMFWPGQNGRQASCKDCLGDYQAGRYALVTWARDPTLDSVGGPSSPRATKKIEDATRYAETFLFSKIRRNQGFKLNPRTEVMKALYALIRADAIKLPEDLQRMWN